MYWGWQTGVLRQLVAVSATMVAFMVAAQFYEPLGGAFNDAATRATPAFFQAMSYLLIMFFVAAAWFVIIRRLYPYTRLGADSDATIRGLDSLGGMFLGIVLGGLLMIATVGVAEGVSVRALADHGIQWAPHDGPPGDSGLVVVRALFKEAPAFANYVGNWVPAWPSDRTDGFNREAERLRGRSSSTRCSRGSRG